MPQISTPKDDAPSAARDKTKPSTGQSIIAQKAWKTYQKQSSSSEKEPQWELLNKYLPLLKSIVSRMRIYFPSHIDIEDIYSLGITGLVGAITKYDPTKSPSFGGYAALRIRGAILDELRRMDWLPRATRTKLKSIRLQMQQLEQKLGRPATEEEMRHHLHMTEAEYANILDMMRPISIVPLDRSVNPDDPEQVQIHEIVGDTNEENAREFCEKHEIIELVRARIGELSEVPRQVLTLYYYEGLRLSEIAEVLGLTESRISQIHAQAIINLRGFIESIRSR